MTKRKTMASIEAEITKLKTQLDNLEKRRERLIAQLALAQKERDLDWNLGGRTASMIKNLPPILSN